MQHSRIADGGDVDSIGLPDSAIGSGVVLLVVTE